MNFNEIQKENMIAFCTWMANGRPESFDELNDSNRRLIKAFSEIFPEALCFDSHTASLFKPNETNLHNFCCTHILDGKVLESEKLIYFTKKFNETNKICFLDEIDKIVKEASGCTLTWS